MSTDDFEKRLRQQPMRELPGAWRSDILRAARAAAPRPSAKPAPGWLSTLNRQVSILLWPNPKAWAGLAAVWLIILGINYSTSADSSSVTARQSAPPSSGLMILVRQQRDALLELTEMRPMLTAERPKTPLLRPRSEVRVERQFA